MQNVAFLAAFCPKSAKNATFLLYADPSIFFQQQDPSGVLRMASGHAVKRETAKDAKFDVQVRFNGGETWADLNSESRYGCSSAV